MHVSKSPTRTGIVALLVLAFFFATAPLTAESTGAEMTDDFRNVLAQATQEWITGECEKSKNSDGIKNKRGYFSREFRPAGDGVYTTTAHIETAGDVTKTSERFSVTLTGAGEKWEVTDSELKDTYAGMHRESGAACVPFDSMNFDREGLKLTASAGSVCVTYYRDQVSSFAVHADDFKYNFEPPDHARALHLLPDFHSLFGNVKTNHQRELKFDPAATMFGCDPTTCAELLDEIFTGLDLEGKVGTVGWDLSGAAWSKPLYDNLAKERRENAFIHFREPYREGDRSYSIFIARELAPFTYPGAEAGFSDFSNSLPGPGVAFQYDKWGGYELQLGVYPRRIDDRDQLFGTIYGYYTEETQKNSTPYEIEQREDRSSRWHQVESVNGTVDMGLVDPEVLAADITFGIELKQPNRILPFFIQSIPQRDASGSNKARVLRVNSVQLDGEDLTWVRTSQLGGLIILPEEKPAGSMINVRMEFETRAMVRYTSTFTAVSRFGWMPFVRFGDFIDEFNLTVRNDADYKLLGIGEKVEDSVEGNIRTTKWHAHSPVVFPSMTLGRYMEADAGKKFDPATKADGTVIPVMVHVDKSSAQDWSVTGKKLEPIAHQAINSINLYREISGLDYPYAKLDFVNDPQGFLYGQAPSSLIYLGQGVFKGAGFLNTLGAFPNAESISKFLKSVVAHEVGHQWWGSRVSNANNRNYWFVESLAEYFSAVYLEMVYGQKDYDEQVDEWRRTILNTNLKSSVQNASAIWSGEGGGYQAAVYNKGPFAFHMLRQIFGDEKFFDFLKKFSMELAEKREIVTLDIQKAAETNLGGIGPDGNPYTVDLGWFFDQWLRGSGLPQYRFDYDARQAEDGGWIVEGTIEQRVVVGSQRNHDVLEANAAYRSVVNITVTSGKDQYEKRVVVEGAQTPFRFKVGKKPSTVELNAKNDTLALDVLVNRPW